MIRQFLLAFAFIIVVFCLFFIFTNKKMDPFANRSDKPRYIIMEDNKLIGFNLVDPEEAPAAIKESVKRGYNIMMNTPFYASEYAKNALSCGNCHLCEGNTLGARNQGISLLGVNKIYPQFSKRSQTTIDLKERIYNCFERSMNGVRPPEGSAVTKDLLAYIHWISSEVQGIDHPPWLGLKLLKSKHTPDKEQGAIVYAKYCVACHQADGAGGGEVPSLGKTIPPLWGEHSFNDGAGMSTIPMLSAFVYWNMPYENSILTEEQALDVAAFIADQPRPQF